MPIERRSPGSSSAGSKRATLHFNYRTKFSLIWDNCDWRERYKYKVKYGDGALAVTL